MNMYHYILYECHNLLLTPYWVTKINNVCIARQLQVQYTPLMYCLYNNAEINVQFIAFHHLLQRKSAKRHIRIIIRISHDGTPQRQTILFSHFCPEKIANF